MSPSLLHGDEDNSRLQNILGTNITSFDVSRILFLAGGGGLPVDDRFPLVSLDCAMELVMSRLILEYVNHVVEVIDGNNIYFARVELPIVVPQIHSLQPSSSCLRLKAGTT